ncbi:MAG: GNAT family N-acetyltransferase [Alphaproteobacteria bacterium]|nr:GNAT family N-acetyltransferase [Alphaproteobacteria bacterium]
MSLIIREGTREDAAAAYGLIEALASHENSAADLKIDAVGFEKAAFSSPAKIGFMVAELEGAIVGVTTWVPRFHIWNNSNIFQLDDLYVSPTARGHGVGSKLLMELGAKAKAEDAGVKWEVMAENEGAIRLYKRIGARVSEKGVCWWPPEAIPG